MTKKKSQKRRSTSSQIKSARLQSYGQKIGFLGGGQLAQMLILKAYSMGLTPYVLAGESSEPAVQVAPYWMKGDPHNLKDLKSFSELVDVLTFESEFFAGYKLENLGQKNRGLKIYPRPETLSLLQDRLFQKELLYEHRLPTAPYIKINSMDDIAIAMNLFREGLVLKKRMGGYDGSGTFVVKDKLDFEHFRLNFKKNENLFIGEAFIPFKRELAISVARNPQGQVVFLPLVESHQKDHRCDYVLGPVEHPRLNELKRKIKFFVNAIDYVGLIAFELFDTGVQLLINEIAPRVHNTGHFTQNALSCDQFEYHLRAILGWDLPEVELDAASFVMTNLIGESLSEAKMPQRFSGHLHWYKKKENRPGRKLGHLNYTSQTLSSRKLLDLALKERKKFKL